MTVNAKALLDRARRVIQDETNVRWPLPELRLWLNDALREIGLVKPTAYSTSAVITLSQGTLQRLPDAYTSVMRIVRNLKSTTDSPRQGGAAIRTVDRETLDAQSPNWHDGTKLKYQKTVRNAAFESADPRAFYVYPGNDGTGVVEAIVSKIPTAVPAPGSGVDDINNYDVNIDIHDIYSNVLLDYILFRAYSKDAQYAGSAQRAAAHYALFSNALGVKVANEGALNPNVKPTAQQENAA